jgi:hypothetical protein
VSVLDAVVQVLSSWAWPAVVLVLVILLRKELAALLRRLQELTGPGGVAAKFGRDAAAASELAAGVVPDVPSQLDVPAAQGYREPVQPDLEVGPVPTQAKTTYLDQLRDQARSQPTSAVILSWQMVERLTELARRRYEIGRASTVTVVRLLAEQGVLNAGLIPVAASLQRLRNEVVHGSAILEIDALAATEFVEAAWRLATALEGALDILNPGDLDDDQSPG